VVVAQAASGTTTPAKPAASGTGSFSPDQKAAIEQIVRDYLLNNPEVLAEAQAAFEAKQEQARSEVMQKSLALHADKIFRSASAPVAGNPAGDVTVVEFFDYNCGYCKRAFGDIARLIESDKKIKVVFKELPIFGKDSEAAARIAIAAKKQDKYWEVHGGLLKLRGKADEAKGLEVAQAAGLDIARLKKDMVSAETTQEIASVRALAEKMGIQGTPHFFVGDKMVPGAPEDLFEILSKHAADLRSAGGCKVC
jgi:protein-disulfide isomerase